MLILLFCSFLWMNSDRYFHIFLKKGKPRPLFVYYRSFHIQLHGNIVDFSEIRTHIVGVEGEHADHLTTSTALLTFLSDQKKNRRKNFSQILFSILSASKSIHSVIHWKQKIENPTRLTHLKRQRRRRTRNSIKRFHQRTFSDDWNVILISKAFRCLRCLSTFPDI